MATVGSPPVTRTVVDLGSFAEADHEPLVVDVLTEIVP
jgi:hypothetical protein